MAERQRESMIERKYLFASKWSRGGRRRRRGMVGVGAYSLSLLPLLALAAVVVAAAECLSLIGNVCPVEFAHTIRRVHKYY